MTRQTMLQVKKESQPLQTGSLFRRQAAQVPVEEHDTAPLPVGFGRDYSHIPFRPPQPLPPMASISCPFSPQRCPFGGACHACPPKMQAKLKIGQPGDRYEQEADRVAEQVMRMPEPNSSPPIHNYSGSDRIIQKQDDKAATTQEKEKPSNSKLTLQLPHPDILSLQKPFFERKAYQIWDTDSAVSVWWYSFNFFKRFGIDPIWAGKAANLAAPFAIDVQLRADNPTWWEVTDNELQTTSRILPIPLFDFESDFNSWRPLPFLQQEPQVQRKCSASGCKDEDDEKKLLQTKPASAGEAGAQVDHPLIQSVLSSPGQPLDAGTRSFMEPRFGQDFSGVRVHLGGQAAESARAVNARAYTVGRNVVFGEGQYAPGSDEGKRLVAHELVHVGQQSLQSVQRKLSASNKFAISEKSNNGIIQRYFEATGRGSVAGNHYRVADDMTAAVKVGYPNHNFYAKPGKVAIANASLSAVGSGIELQELSTTFKVSKGSISKTLKKVLPKNKQNATSGTSMKLWDDCGESAGVVVGGTNRTAIHRDAMTGKTAKTIATSPSLMKAEIMKKLLDKWLTMASTTAATKKKINDTIAAANTKKVEITATETAYAAATTDAARKALADIYWEKVDQYGNIMMSFYNTLSAAKREEIDNYLKINKYADPNVGQGYTMSTGGTNYPGKKTWNFHWGGVVMKSDDRKDNITLENYAMGGTTKVENTRWDFAMYGTEKKDQTFHEQHRATEQHGDMPTTMTIEEK